MKEHLKILGLKGKDRVSGMVGVVSSVCFDLSGCVQGYIRPMVDKDMKHREGGWFDTKQIEILSTKPVIPVSDFSAPPGAQAKGHK